MYLNVLKVDVCNCVCACIRICECVCVSMVPLGSMYTRTYKTTMNKSKNNTDLVMIYYVKACNLVMDSTSQP